MGSITLYDAATLYWWIWELLALIFILTNAFVIWRVNVLEDLVRDLIKEATHHPEEVA